jgi:hypothetical protein
MWLNKEPATEGVRRRYKTYFELVDYALDGAIRQTVSIDCFNEDSSIEENINSMEHI